MDRNQARIRYLTAVVLYGTIGLLLHYIDLPSEIVVLCRAVLGTAFIAAYILWKGRRPDRHAIRKNAKWLILSGICLGLNWIFLFAAYRQTTVAVASICNYTAPIIVLALAPLLLRERATKRGILCIAAAFLGIILVSGVLSGDPAGLNLPGVGLGLMAAVCFAVIVLCNRKLRDIDSLDRTVTQLFLSALTVLPYVLLADRGISLHPDLRSVVLVLVLGIFQTGVAYIFYFGPMGVLPVQTVAILGYVEPVVSVLCSTLILKEPLPAAGWFGAFLIIGASVISELRAPAPAGTGSEI